LPTRWLLAADNPPAAKTPKMKFALMTYTFARQGWKKDGKFDLAGMCKVGQKLGIDGVDIVSHSFSPLDPALIRQVVADHGQKVVCYTFFPKLNQSTAAARAPGLEEVKKGVEIAKALGTDKIMIHTPGDSKMPGDVCRANWIVGLQEAIPVTRAAALRRGGLVRREGSVRLAALELEGGRRPDRLRRGQAGFQNLLWRHSGSCRMDGAQRLQGTLVW
jgi:hypothetical protein